MEEDGGEQPVVLALPQERHVHGAVLQHIVCVLRHPAEAEEDKYGNIQDDQGDGAGCFFPVHTLFLSFRLRAAQG